MMSSYANSCPYLREVDTNGYALTFDEAMRLPESIEHLEIDQHSISASEFGQLIRHLKLTLLLINSCTFHKDEIEEIEGVDPRCQVITTVRPYR